ncbi:MAG: isopentenyl-diphosphate Delta-isomerase [Parcubacteria group bacterium]|jgi:isopentenyl-diphosphate delta-isomerase
MKELVILVDENDTEVGAGEKLRMHQEGKLHRAFSVFIFNSKGELLIQRRAGGKYHSAGLWSNTCCGHPRPGEGVNEAAQRRLEEEMGFACPLRMAFSFRYNTRLEQGLIENEYDYVFCGTYDSNPEPNSEEVAGWKWTDTDEIRKDMLRNPNSYTHWFKIAIKRLDQTGKSTKNSET